MGSQNRIRVRLGLAKLVLVQVGAAIADVLYDPMESIQDTYSREGLEDAVLYAVGVNARKSKHASTGE